jgi:predicted dehydrogenase
VNDIRLAVIGVGHLGAIHARLSQQIEGVTLVGIVDPSEPAHTALAAELNVTAYADHRPLLGQIDAAIVATPSRTHHSVASDLLAHGVHVFVEKPMTLNVGDAADLIHAAEAAGLVLQIGHVERFNPAYQAAHPHLPDPKYIEAARTGPYTCRSTDIGVVLDLMIHDIDIALALSDDDVVAVDALGASVVGPNEDWAQARLTFSGGCVANLFASRVSWQARRSMQVTCPDRSAEIDFAARQARLMQVGEPLKNGLEPARLTPAARAHLKDHLFEEYLPLKTLQVQETNPLCEEQLEFLHAIRTGQGVTVSGHEGRAALDVAERVLTSIAAHRWDGATAGPIGPRQATRESILRGPHWRQASVHRKAG